MDWKIGIDMYTKLYIKEITNENLPQATGDSIRALRGPEWEGTQKAAGIYLHTADSFAVQRKLTQHYKATTCQQKCT